ncbi:MAG: NAD-dependent malic enzyme [Acidimicrobiia bacterium]|nr:NAD-dependent malic enzyme [Acidimicrobiia bacterium]
MRYQPVIDPVTGEPYLPVTERGRTLLDNPILNKGTSFSDAERHALGITGLLPRHISSIAEQLQRTLDQLRDKDSDLQKAIYLAGLHDRNETLFYRLVIDNLEETVPLIYTPTVAEVCREWSRIFRRSRGVYVTPDDRGDVAALLRNYGAPEIAVIVITDNERILGIGDQGVGGMGIPIGKLALYTAAAGIHPSLCLPISLDVGTDNADLLANPMYLGYRAPRLRGDAYWELVDEVVAAVREVFPGALLQWEDFGNTTSFRHLETYRGVLPSFNDDIQGTAAMVVAGLHAANRLLGNSMRDHRMVIAGAGSAGIGIFRQLEAAMVADGLAPEEAKRRILVTDSRGLVIAGQEQGNDFKREVAVDAALAASLGGVDLETVVVNHRPSVLVGVTGQPGTFTATMIEAMAAAHERPIVMPLSNPTACTEAFPADILAWSHGRALVATGSPFPPVMVNGSPQMIGQANNMFIFPGMGLGTVVARARTITIGMVLAAAEALAAHIDMETLRSGALFPQISRVREVSRSVALAVAAQAAAEGVAEPLVDPAAAITAAMWEPVYVPYRAV